MLIDAYMKAYAYASEKGIFILDTKFEIGVCPDGSVAIIDEGLTPDSSRFTSADDWEKAMAENRDPIFYDKEPVRVWGKTIETPFFDSKCEHIVGIHKLNPGNSDHVDFVHSLKVPEEIITATTERYCNIFQTLTDHSLENYQKNICYSNKRQAICRTCLLFILVFHFTIYCKKLTS